MIVIIQPNQPEFKQLSPMENLIFEQKIINKLKIRSELFVK
jgi:hypothetical protein